MNNLSNIVVYIKDEAMLEEARGMLRKYEQPIANGYFFTTDKYNKILFYDEETPDWIIYYETEGRQEISLLELENLLKQNRDVR